MSRQRTYSLEFKRSMVRLVLDGEKTPLQVCQEHQVSKSVLYRWLQDFTMRGEAAFQRTGHYQRKQHLGDTIAPGTEGGIFEAFIAKRPGHSTSLEAQIADLERLCGQLAVENFLLRRALAEVQQSVS